MIHFNELRISPDSKCLIIDAEIDSDTFFKDVYIDNIIIDSQDTFITNGPSSTPIYKQSFLQDIPKKRVRIKISAGELGVDLTKSMLFVYVTAVGAPNIKTPCGWDNPIIMKSVINLLPLYRLSLAYIKELNSNCTTPKGFIDFILRFKALELYIKTGNYLEAIKLWNKFFKNSVVIPINNCGCNG